MAGGFDGTVRIDTSLDSKGFNSGIDKMGAKTGSLAKQTGASMSGVMNIIKKAIFAIGFLFTAEKIISFVRSAIGQFDIMGSVFGSKLTEMKTALDGLKAALVNALLNVLVALSPYIIAFLGWLTRILTVITQVIAALFGASAAMKGLATATGTASKVAKGTLAAFDQINVLQKDNGTEATVLPPMPTISPEILAMVDEWKQKILTFFQPLIDAFQRFWEASAPLRQTLLNIFQWIWDNILVPLGTWAIQQLLPALLDLFGGVVTVINSVLVALKPLWDQLWADFLKPLAEATGAAIIAGLEWLTARLYDLSAWIDANPEKFRTIVQLILDFAAAWLIVKTAYEAYVAIGAIVATVQGFIAEGGLAVAASMALIVIEILVLIALIALLIYMVTSPEFKNAIEDWKVFFAGLFDFVKIKITSAIEDWKVFFQGFADFVPLIFRAMVNAIIDMINSMNLAVASGINTLIDGLNSLATINLPGFSIGATIQHIPVVQIPRLATGAVIPPNAQFAAILGDQRNGNNIEAPESLIRQIVAEEIANMPPQKVTIEFSGNMAALVREMLPSIKQESTRMGGSLIRGAA
jgi:hypothetical protein